MRTLWFLYQTFLPPGSIVREPDWWGTALPAGIICLDDIKRRARTQKHHTLSQVTLGSTAELYGHQGSVLESVCQSDGWESSRAGENIFGKTFTFSCVCKSGFSSLEQSGEPVPTRSSTTSVPVLCTNVLCVWNFLSRSCRWCSKSSISRKHKNCLCTDNPVLSGHIRHATKSPANYAEHGL